MPDQLSIRYLYYDAENQLIAEASEVEVAVGASMFKLRKAIASDLQDYGLSGTELLPMTLWRPNAELLTGDNAPAVLRERISTANGYFDAIATKIVPDDEFIGGRAEQRNNSLVHVIAVVNLPYPTSLASNVSSPAQDDMDTEAQRRATEVSWTHQYVGDAADALWEHITKHYSPVSNSTGTNAYANYVAVVQSSGTGKSRTIDEMSKKHFVIPMNLRKDGSSGTSRLMRLGCG